MKPLTYSLVSAYNLCPLKAYHEKIAYTDFGVIEDTEARERGIAVHASIDKLFKRREAMTPLDTIPEIVFSFLDYAVEQRWTEMYLGMTYHNEPCDYKDPKCWARGKLDLVLFDGDAACILDWKTGKRREDPLELEFHGMLLKANYPKLTSIKAAYVWLQDGEIGDMYDVSNTSYIKETAIEVRERVEREVFPPTPNFLCQKYCSVLTCKFNGKRK